MDNAQGPTSDSSDNAHETPGDYGSAPCGGLQGDSTRANAPSRARAGVCGYRERWRDWEVNRGCRYARAKGLTATHRAALALLASGISVRDVCATLPIGESTLYQLRASRTGQRILARLIAAHDAAARADRVALEERESAR
jgi:hypothetical protein